MFKKWFMAVLMEIKEIATIEEALLFAPGAEPLDPKKFETPYKQVYTREQVRVLRHLDHCDVFGEKGNLCRVFDDLDSIGNGGIKFSVMEEV